MINLLESDVHETVLLTTFTINRRQSRVYLHRGKLIWESERLPHSQHQVELKNVIGVKSGEGSQSKNLIVDYAKRVSGSIWRHCRIVMIHNDYRQVVLWVRTIENHLAKFQSRPKRLLLFVNPYGGKKKALKIFEKHGKPLFKIANVDVSVIISQRANQITDLVMSLNLDIYDAIACVGGDGTFSELFNGLIMKTCKDKNIELNHDNMEIPMPSIPVGVIPGGSTDTVAYSMHGTSDIQTAVLYIIFGDTVGLDIASTFQKENFVRFYASVMSYGFLGDVARDSENFRWMGPKRYDYSGFKKILSNTGYDGELRLLCETNETDELKRCLENCDTCQSKRVEATSGELTEWKTVKGKFFMVSGANVSCACTKSPNGIAPYGHLGDGFITLVVVRHTSTLNVLRLLLRLSSKAKTIDDLSFVETYKVREFEFGITDRSQENIAITAGSTNSVWNCDGEVIPEAEVHVKVHCQLLKVFSRGPNLSEPEPSCTCFL